jgi:hypothetical protein
MDIDLLALETLARLTVRRKAARLPYTHDTFRKSTAQGVKIRYTLMKKTISILMHSFIVALWQCPGPRHRTVMYCEEVEKIQAAESTVRSRHISLALFGSH